MRRRSISVLFTLTVLALTLPAASLLSAPAAAGSASAIDIGGRVLGPKGVPFVEAEALLLPVLDPLEAVKLSDSGAPPKPAARALTDTNGSFRLTAPRAGLWKIRVQSSGFVPLEYRLEPLLEPEDLPDVEMLPDFGLTVKVTGSDGKPLSGARVRLAPPGPREMRFDSASWQPPVRMALTDANGAAVLLRAEKEPSVVTVSAPGHVLQERRNVKGTAAVFKLQPGSQRAVAVLSADRSPAPGVLVQSADFGHPLGFTDAQGRVSVAVAPGGELPVLLIASDGRRVQGTVSDRAADPKSRAKKTAGAPAADPAATTLSPVPESDPHTGATGNSTPSVREFRLPARLAVKGRLIDARTRAAVPGGLVWTADEMWAATPTDASGGYSLSGPAGRTLQILAGAAGYLNSSAVPFTFAADRGPAPTLALNPAAVIEGTVTDEEGRPVAGAEASLDIKRGGDRMIVVFGRQPEIARAVTSARGTFRLSPIDPANNYTLKVAAQGFAPSTKEIIGLEPHGTMGGVRVEISRGQSVSGRVVDSDGRPIREADASLRAASRARRSGGTMMVEMGGGASPSLKATTDNEGRFRIAGIGSGTFDLEIRRNGFAKKTLPAIDTTKPEPVDLGDVVMEPGLRVHGIVAAPDGSPIEGVEVSIASAQPGPMMMMGMGRAMQGPPPAAVTGPDGRFAVEDMKGGEPVTLSFNRSGFLQTRESGVQLPREDPVQITMKPASKVTGQVVGPDKKPIPGAEVSLTRSTSGGIGNEMFKMMMRDSDTAGDDGRFVFDNVSPGSISLSAVAPASREAKIDGLEVIQGKDLEGVQILLESGASVTGRVLSPDGRPVIGARVGLVTDDNGPLGLGGATSDGDGVYRLEGLTPGRFSLEATHDDYVRAAKEIEARVGSNKLDLRFEGGQEISGLVVDPSGSAVGGVFVQLSSAGRDWGGPDATTRPDGTFKMEGVGDGDYTLHASREGYAPSRDALQVHVEGKPVAGLKVQLAVGGRITGKITGVDPAKLTQVDIRAGSSEGSSSSTVDREGVYKLENLLPGNWTVTAALPATGQQARGRVVLEEGASEATLDLQFGQGLTLSGRAVHGDAPIVGAVLFAQGTDVNHSAWGRTGAEGSFRMEGLEPGKYRVELRHWESGLSYDETVDITSSREVTLKVPSARVIGRVVDGIDRRPIAGATVALSRAGQEGRGSPVQQRAATSDLTGRFEIANIMDGTWTVTASKTGYAASTAEVSVQSNRDVDDVRVVLDATEGLALEARLPSGRFPEMVDVAVLDASGRSISAGSYATGENGRVRLSSVPAGSWDLVVSAAGSGVMNLRVNVPGPTVSALLPQACNLKVTVPALAGTSTAATATIKGQDGKVFRTLGWMSDVTSQWRLSGGRLEIDTLPPGSWTVQVASADGRTWTGTSSTQAGAPAEVLLQ